MTNDTRLAPKDATAPADFDARMYLRIIWKRKFLILATLGMVVGGVAVWTMLQTPIYTASATVVIDPQAPKILPTQDVVELGSGNLWDNQAYYNTQVRILRSRSLAEAVVRRYPSVLRIKALAGAPSGDAEAIAASYVNAGVVVQPVRESRIFSIGFRDPDPQLAADLANEIVGAFIEQNRAVKLSATTDASRWVSKQLDEARKELASSETALYEFKKEKGILSVNLEERQNLISKSLIGFSTALDETKKKRIELETRYHAIIALMSADDATVPSSYVAASETIGPLRTIYLDESRKLKTLTDRYGEKWPEVEQQKVLVQAALVDVRADGKRLVASIGAEVKALIDTEGRRYLDGVSSGCRPRTGRTTSARSTPPWCPLRPSSRACNSRW